jgi:transmembrane sensor
VIDRREGRKNNSLGEVAIDLAGRALAIDATSEDEAALRAWGGQSPDHARAIGEALKLHARLFDARDAIRADPNMAEMIDRARQWRAPRTHPVLSRRAMLTGAVAASAAGLVLVNSPFGLWPPFGEWRADYRTGTGERRKIEIAKGFAIELNTRSALDRRPDDRAYRLQLIAGEVAVDARALTLPAVIETGLGQASTRSGRFSARLRDEGMCIACFAGEVAVDTRTREAVRLRRGQQVTVGPDGKAALASVDLDVADAWQRGALIFNGRPLSEVVGELNRYRPGRIILTNAALGSRTVNAIFQIDRLGNAPVEIGNLTRARVTDLPGGLVLLS